MFQTQRNLEQEDVKSSINVATSRNYFERNTSVMTLDIN